MSSIEILMSVPEGRAMIVIVIGLSALEALLVSLLANSYFTEEKDVIV